MANYRRAYVPGGTFFLTIVTYRRQPILGSRDDVERFRQAIARVKEEWPFQIPGAIVMPNHVHFLSSLPPGDTDYSRRIGRIKVLFTRAVRGEQGSPSGVSESRRKHRESDVWHRRFWEHTVENEGEFERFLHYIHYNPVKHGLVSCPHLWPFSSFGKWVEAGLYTSEWGCSCGGRRPVLPAAVNQGDEAGE